VNDSDDLLDKTDALLGRYRGGSNHAPDADFPVLTEIVAAPGIEATGFPVMEVMPPQAPKIPAAGNWQDDHLLQEVMRALEPRIEEILGDPLKERLEDHLRPLLDTLTSQIRIDIETLVRIAVSRAVEQVLSEKKNP
jgi:hypothetical protein